MVRVGFDLQKRDFAWILLIVVLFGVGFAYSYGGSDPDVMGHSMGELELDTGVDCRTVSGAFPNTQTVRSLSCNADEYLMSGGGYCGGCDMLASRPDGLSSWELYCRGGCSAAAVNPYHMKIICCKK